MSRSSGLPFVKAEANGNDFLLLAAAAVPPPRRAAVAREICDRRLGLGADGVEWWRFNPRRRELNLALHNADGSEAEMSGNGTRCAVAWCTERFGAQAMAVVTAAGRKRARRLPAGSELHDRRAPADGAIWIELELGLARFQPAEIPMTGASGPVREFPLAALGRTWPVTALSVGNPQCCILVEEFPVDWAEVAAALGRHPAFPQQANVEFVRLINRQQIEIRICERGAGVTPSSGTGSCAAAITAILAGRAVSPLWVQAPGGGQEVAWEGPASTLRLRGPARLVGCGRYHPRAGGQAEL
ncbi:MAG: diaminopimelate epimerase [Terriglobales bacterium]